MGRQTFIRSREPRSNKALKVAKQNSQIESKLKITKVSDIMAKMSPRSAKKRGRGTKTIEWEEKSSNTPASILNGSIKVKLSNKKTTIKTVKQSDKRVSDKTNTVRNRRSIDKNRNEGKVIDKKIKEDKKESTKSPIHKQDTMTKNSKSGCPKTMHSRSSGRTRSNKKAPQNKSITRRKYANSESTNQSKTKIISDKEVEKAEVNKKASNQSRSGKTARTASEVSEVVGNGIKHKLEVGGRKRPALKLATKDSVRKRLAVRQVNGKKSTDKPKSVAEMERSVTTEGKSDEEETVIRSPPKRKSKTDGLEIMEKSFNKKCAIEIKNKIESEKAPKRKQIENGGDVSTDPPTKLRIVASDTQRPDVSKGPSTKRRKTSSSVDRKKSVPKKVKDPSNEDPYDFEAYLSTITPGKRKKAQGSKKEKKMNGTEKRKTAPQKRVWGRQAPLRTAWGGIARRGGTAPAHKFFIQPSRPKKKSQQSDHVEEPSPSIAEEIVEFTLQPPYVSVDDEEEPGQPLGVPTSSMIISTPRAALTAAPLLRPMGATVISPISAPTEVDTRTSTAPQVEQIEPLALETSNPENPSHSEPKAVNEKERVRKAQKAVTKQVKEKDEFEVWLEKFSRELSDIESFELSIERS